MRLGADAVIGLIHPGEMGAALGSELRRREYAVLWASAGRGSATARRAELADLRDVGTVGDLVLAADVIVSVCPPHAAEEVARSVSGFDGVFLEANAISPETSRMIGAVVEADGGRYVDGGIVGSPPHPGETTRLYLSGPSAPPVVELFEGTAVDARLVSDQVGAASAVKMAYAAWTKGTAALLLAIRALARTEYVEAALLAEWEQSLPELPDQSRGAAAAAGRKGWRWVGEMEQIASTFESVGLPNGFHQAAAEIFARVPRLDDGRPNASVLDQVLADVGSRRRAAGSAA